MDNTSKGSTLLGEAFIDAIRLAVREEIKAALKISEYGGQADRLLDVEEAAKILNVPRSWMYAHARQLPFSRRLGAKALRFSYRGIQAWIERGKQ